MPFFLGGDAGSCFDGTRCLLAPTVVQNFSGGDDSRDQGVRLLAPTLHVRLWLAEINSTKNVFVSGTDVGCKTMTARISVSCSYSQNGASAPAKHAGKLQAPRRGMRRQATRSGSL